MAMITDFIHMGGYAFYVWSSYGIAAVVLLANVWWSLRSLRASRRKALERAARASRTTTNNHLTST